MQFDLRRRPLFFAAIAYAALVPALFPETVAPKTGPTGRTVFLGGKIISEVESRDMVFGYRKIHFLLDVERRWDGLGPPASDVNGAVRVTWKNAPHDLRYGDVIVLEGEIARFPDKRNPGGFDSAAYWNRRGVWEAFFAKEKARYKVLARGQGGPLKTAAIKAKQYLSRRLTKDFDRDQSAFLKALFLGEKKDIDQEFKDLFLNTGTIHILAVSGFNIGFLCAVLWLLLRPLPFSRSAKLAALLLATWSYCLLVGWQAPVVRATIMASVFLTGRIIGREGDGLNALGLAALVILLLNPFELYEPGFQLSFLAVFGILTLAPVFIRRPDLLPNEVWTLREKLAFRSSELFWVSFICYFITLPVVLHNFYIVTPFAVPANFIVVPLSFLLFLFALPYFVFPFLSWLMKFVIALLVKGLFAIEALPGAVWNAGEPPLWLAAVLAGGIALLFYTHRFKSRRARAVAIVLFCLNVLAVQELLRLTSRRFEMTMLDVGQGDAAYFEFPGGGNLLVDGGERRFSDKGRWVVAPFLRSKGVRKLDAVLVTHAHDDHIGGLFTVLKDFDVRHVFESGLPHGSRGWNALQAEISKEGCEVDVLRRGDRVEGFSGTRIDVLHPERGATGKNPNEDSIVFKLRHGDLDVLMTGDIEKSGMRSLIASGADLRSRILKVPHHGGKAGEQAEAFFNAVSPELSLISVGARNPFRHPAPAILDSLEAVSGNRILRTDLTGSLRIALDDHGLVVES